MSAPRPVRLQRKRAKGFDLQAVSRAANGLPGRAVTRPGDFGNPFQVGQWFRVGEVGEEWRWLWKTAQFAKHDLRFTFVADAETAVAMHKTMLERHGPPPRIRELVGHNLFCFCRLCPRHAATGKPFDEDCDNCAPYHADELGRRALALVCEGLDA
ncbi:hypothetical protein [Methylocystis parvus]|uniref:hypothetical protein n=1 Tax=Methylocystis parvus TaxID=134 RepID=UPI003C7247F6